MNAQPAFAHKMFIAALFFAHTTVAQNVGIGTGNPVHAPLEINGAVGTTVAIFGADKNGIGILANEPAVGFNVFGSGGNAKTIKAGYAGYMKLGFLTGDLVIGTYGNNTSVTDFGSISGERDVITIKQTGNIGIGTSSPAFPLTVHSGSGPGIAQESPDGTALVGFFTSNSEAYVQTYTNTDLNFTTGNGVSRMALKTDGSLAIYNSLLAKEKITTGVTGNANLLPLAYAKINFDGTVLRSTSNIVVTKLGIGKFQVTITGEPSLYTNRNNFMMMTTPESNLYAYMSGYSFQPNNTILVETWRPRINYTDNNCSCTTFSLINNALAQEPGDCNFSFLIYKY